MELALIFGITFGAFVFVFIIICVFSTMLHGGAHYHGGYGYGYGPGYGDGYPGPQQCYNSYGHPDMTVYPTGPPPVVVMGGVMPMAQLPMMTNNGAYMNSNPLTGNSAAPIVMAGSPGMIGPTTEPPETTDYPKRS
ncbi:hypothetical protein RvY_16218 [Ramazzottius varieornatus]|uniref:Uncharacterized protein n=1 Tax=Ramazzottius varieornatus TaxID=947166 RepID=A0A1D1VXQ0_RAMVA|nr:hypothetical protein RvY_16218 [Ramazzottius varieornatus]